MPDDINKAALSSGWAIFLSSVQPDQRADPQLFGNELMRPLSDEFVSWAGTRPDLVGADDSTIARRFASALSLFAERYDLVSRQANGIAESTVAGAWRLYLQSEASDPGAGESPFAGYIASLIEGGREQEAGILSRILFARWEDDPRIDAAIEKLTKEALSGPVPVKISLLGKNGGGKTKLTLDNPGAARALLEDHLGSRITVSDLIELMDIGSPLMPLKEIVIERFSAAGERPNLTVSGAYAGHAGEENSTSYKINIRLGPDGRPDISYRTIEIDPVYRGGGMAARSVLALALFARRHGADGWADLAANMGIFAWSKLGARFNPKHLEKALYLIEELELNGIAPNIDLGDIDPEDIDSIADFWIWESSLTSRDSFENWLMDHGTVATWELGEIGARIPLGKLALRSVSIEVTYETEEVLDMLVEDYFPSRIRRMENNSTEFAHDDLGLLGMGEALERAYSERALADAFERRLTITKKRFGGIVKTDPTKENGEIKNAPDLSFRLNEKESEAASTKTAGTTNSAVVPVAPAVKVLR